MKYRLPINQKGLAHLLPLLLIVLIAAGILYLIVKNPYNLSGLKQRLAQKPLAPHYDISLVGVSDAKNLPQAKASASIYVPTVGNCSLNLVQGDFSVSDSDCVLDQNASFSLPANSVGDDAVTTYDVFVKSLDNKVSQGTDCRKDGDSTYCPIQSMVVVRSQDQTFSSEVSKLLFNAYVDLQGSGTPARYFLFDDALKNVFWSADTAGNKVVQVRFYPQSVQQKEQEAKDSDQ